MVWDLGMGSEASVLAMEAMASRNFGSEPDSVWET
jgi:hypothetical protein